MIGNTAIAAGSVCGPSRNPRKVASMVMSLTPMMFAVIRKVTNKDVISTNMPVTLGVDG